MLQKMSDGVFQPFPAGFCRDNLWDPNVTWYTENPDLTACFQNTVLVWLPSAIFWLFLPVHLFKWSRRKQRNSIWTWNCLSRIALCLILVTLLLVEMFAVVYDTANVKQEPVFLAELYGPMVKAITLVFVAAVIYLDRKRAKSSSALLTFFWLVMLVIGIITYRSSLMSAVHKGIDSEVKFAIETINLPCLFAIFVISCFGERFSEIDSKDPNPCPEQFASFVSRLIFSWFDKMAYQGWKKPLQMEDLWSIQQVDKTKYQVDLLLKNWDEEISKHKRSMDSKKKAQNPSLTKALVKTYWLPVFTSGLLRIVNDLSIFVTPQILQLLIGFVEDPSQPVWKGYLYAVLMLVGACVQTIVLNYYLGICFRMGMHVRGSIVAAVYRKSLKITSEAKRSSNIGEVVNLMSVDAQRFMDFMAYIHVLWSGFFQMGLAIFFLWRLLGNAVFAGLGAMLVTFPINGLIISRIRKLQAQQMKEKDGRIKIMSEVLSGMKVLKLYAWEESFQKLVTEIRERELTTLKKAAYLGCASYATWIMSPFLVALATFATYVLSGPENILTPERVFVALSLLNILRVPLTLLPTAITMAVQVNIAIKRLNNFFNNEELDDGVVTPLSTSDPSSVKVTNGNFAWGKKDSVCLKDIDFSIKTSQLVAVVGPVGSGKSSLCSAVLGLMERRSGTIGVKGSVAYVPQQAWIQNLTVKENILFGREMDRVRYEQTLDACSLRTDLKLLAAADDTEIGERGTNLSGGQRQRISLARAVFSDSDVYVLDDVLSAVDSHVGKHIFENVIGPNGMLRNKTRILVTHGISYLPQTDLILVLNDGTITEAGSYKELLRKKGAFADFIRTYLSESVDDSEEPDELAGTVKEELLEELGENIPAKQPDRSLSIISRRTNGSIRRVQSVFRRNSKKPVENLEEKEKEEVKGKLIGEESTEIGGVKWIVYWMLLKQMSIAAVFGFTFFNLIAYGMSIGANFWLSDWALDASQPELAGSTKQRDFRLGIYSAFGGVQVVFVLLSSFALAVGRIRASRTLHDGMLRRIMRAPMSFFDQTPLGRIVNRFSKDVDTVDVMIPATIDVWLYCAFSVLSTIIVVCVNTPIFAVVIVPLGVFYYFMQRFFISTSRQLKRLEAVSRSPIFSHFQESVLGNNVIFATRQSDRFVRENERLVDVNNGAYYPNIISQRWIAIRLEFIGICVTFFAALFAVLGRDNPGWGISASEIGLSISYSISITQILNWFVRMTSELEANVVSVERIKEYSEVSNEAEWIVPNSRPPKEWPSNGQVEFRDYKTRYRPELDLVLKGVNARIQSGEKIGIVGRTGAGKSSLTLALFRIIEAAGGEIQIDGLRLDSLGLHDVRSRITILPQEPVLFSGSLRMNLDPFDQFSDEEVWRSLENSHLKKFVASLPEGLNHVVSDGGDNYSVGQRQLICLARALLRKTKILVLDEATAAVDLETDELIQETIRDKFKDCTVLTIAHRLNTVMDSSRIMVLDQGVVREFDAPANLLTDKDSIFYGMAKSANLVT